MPYNPYYVPKEHNDKNYKGFLGLSPIFLLGGGIRQKC